MTDVNRQSALLDRTLKLQNKAPIRSQAMGLTMLRERQHPIDRSTQRQLYQSQHGAGWAGRSVSVYTEYPSNYLCDSYSELCHAASAISDRQDSHTDYLDPNDESNSVEGS